MNGAKNTGKWRSRTSQNQAREAVVATVSRCNRPQLYSSNLETIFLWVKLNAYASFILSANQSIFTTLKKQTIHGERFLTRQAAQQHIFEYIECYYNHVRWHPNNSWIALSILRRHFTKESRRWAYFMTRSSQSNLSSLRIRNCQYLITKICLIKI